MGRRSRRTRRGTALVELAVVLPLLVLFLFGIWEVGRALDMEMIFENAASVGGRQASNGVCTNAQVQQIVLNYLQSAGVPTQNAVVSVSDLTNPGTDVSAATQLDALRITISVPFRDVRWAVSGFFFNSSAQLTAQAIYRSAKGVPYPTGIAVPAGW